MKERKKGFCITCIIVILIIIVAILIILNQGNSTEENVAKCIGKNSILYVQLGCHACGRQEEMFGENVKYLNIIDCFFQREKCEDIVATPTWKINEELIRGVQSIEELKQLTGCN